MPINAFFRREDVSINKIKSTLLISPFMDNATQVLVGPDMPQAVDSHCFIKIFNDLALTIGGKTGEKLPSRSTNFYIISSGIWSQGPDLVQHVSGHSCGVVDDYSNKSKTMVVVVGQLKMLKLKLKLFSYSYSHPSDGHRRMDLDE